ncbi:MAG: pilus assembly protein PilM [Candidatus Brocadiae bacterium]|nr:pilus assembly protein PilM [Candidatus Brocadiia bacterium]
MGSKIGIDVGSSCLRFAQISLVKRESKLDRAVSFPVPFAGSHYKIAFPHDVRLERVISFPLPGSEEDNFSQPCALSLKEYLKKNNFKIQEGLAGISGKHLNMRYLQVPSNNDARIAQIVEMEMAQVLEKANTPLAYSYRPLELPLAEKKQGCVVAIAVVYESFLQNVWDFFRQAGIKITAFVPNTIALHQAFYQFSQNSPKETNYVVDIGYENTNLVVSQGDNLFLARNVNMGSKMLTLKIQEEKNWEFQEAEKFKIQKLHLSVSENNTIAKGLEESFEEIILNTAQKIPDSLEASLKFAKVQTGLSGLKVDRIYLAGGGACQKGMKDLIQNNFSCPVDFLQWKDVLGEFPKEIIDEKHQHIFCNSIGLAYLAHQKKIPLKILGYNQKIQEMLFGRHLFEYLSIAVMFLLVVFSLWTTLACYQRYEKWEEQLQEKYQKLSERSLKNKEIQKENDLLETKINHIQNRLYPNKTLLEILSWLQKSMPSQIHLSKLEWKASSKLVLSLYGFVEEETEDVYFILKKFKESIKKHDCLVIEEERDPKLQEQEKKLEFFLKLRIEKKK